MAATPRHRLEPESFARGLVRVGVGLLAILGILRAGLFLAAAFYGIPAPDQPFHLEGASVHFAWRAQQALPLYPPPSDGCYAINYMGPCYFWTVGLLGRLCHADLAELHVNGRWVVFLCGLGPALLAGAYLRRRYGGGPAWLAVAFAMGAAPMLTYGVVSRPDAMADLLGVAGFFAACLYTHRSGVDNTRTAAFPWGRLLVAAALFALGCLTKQTTVVWLLAAMLVLLTEKDKRREALALGGATAVLVLAAITILAYTSEPYIVSSLLSQGVVGYDWQQPLGILLLLFRRSPDMLFFVLVGCGLWLSGRYRDRALFIGTAVGLLAAVFLCTKKGSDLNYFLPLRFSAGLAAGTLCVAAWRDRRHRPAWGLLVGVGVLAMIPSLTMTSRTIAKWADARHCAAGQLPPTTPQNDLFQHLVKLAADPNVRLLTDSDRLAVHQGTRAAFCDCFLFRLRVDAGHLDTRTLVDRLESHWYQYVVLSADVEGDYRDNFFYRLPTPLAAAIRANYRLEQHAAGWYIYVPRLQ